MEFTSADLHDRAVLTLLIPHSAQSDYDIEKSRVGDVVQGIHDKSCPNLNFKAKVVSVPGSGIHRLLINPAIPDAVVSLLWNGLFGCSCGRRRLSSFHRKSQLLSLYRA